MIVIEDCCTTGGCVVLYKKIITLLLLLLLHGLDGLGGGVFLPAAETCEQRRDQDSAKNAKNCGEFEQQSRCKRSHARGMIKKPGNSETHAQHLKSELSQGVEQYKACLNAKAE